MIKCPQRLTCFWILGRVIVLFVCTRASTTLFRFIELGNVSWHVVEREPLHCSISRSLWLFSLIAFSIHILEVANQIPWKTHEKQESKAVRRGGGSVTDREADKVVWRSNIGGFSCPAQTGRAHSTPGNVGRHCPDPFSLKQLELSTVLCA